MDNRQSRAQSAVKERREKALAARLARTSSRAAIKDWIGHVEKKIQEAIDAGPPTDKRKTQPLWPSYCQTVSARRLALLICDAVLRPRREEDELEDWAEQRRPATWQTVAGDIGTALAIPGADRRERKHRRDTVGMELLNIAFLAGLISKPQSGVKGRSAPCTLSDVAQGQLAEIYTALVLSGELLAEQPVFDRPAPIVNVRPNWRGACETPANDSATVIEAVNAMQSTAWRVNKRMLHHLIKSKDPAAEVRKASAKIQAAEEDAKPVRKLLRAALKEGAGKPSKVQARKIGAARKKLVPYVTAIKRCEETLREWFTLLQATALEGKTFYYRVRFDYRGRVYQVGGRLQYTSGDDLARSLLEFAHGSPLDTLGRGALANYADEQKDKHRRQAALFALEDKEVHFPVALDCTQSGLQIYALLMRDSELGFRVNVFRKDPEPITESPPPAAAGRAALLLHFAKQAAALPALSGVQDFYQLVADDVAIKGVDRAVIKALGNPQIYGAGLLLQTDKLAELTGRSADDKQVRREAAKIRAAIFRLAPAFQTLSAWLRAVAALCSAHNLPLRWTHRDGFEVLQDSRRLVKGRDRFYLPGHKRSIDYGTKEPTDIIDTHAQERQVAANYVHSCDGMYLREVLRQSVPAAMGALAVAHDSFACHPNNVARLHGLMLKVLEKVYDESLLVGLWHEINGQGIFGLPTAHSPWMEEGFTRGELAT
jgi:hypothetical protein